MGLIFLIHPATLCLLIGNFSLTSLRQNSPFSASNILPTFACVGSILFLFPFYVFVVSNYPFLCCELKIEVPSFCFFFAFPPFNIYVIINCLKPILIESCSFPILSLCHIKVLCTFAFLFQVEELLSTFLVRQV